MSHRMERSAGVACVLFAAAAAYAAFRAVSAGDGRTPGVWVEPSGHPRKGRQRGAKHERHVAQYDRVARSCFCDYGEVRLHVNGDPGGAVCSRRVGAVEVAVGHAGKAWGLDNRTGRCVQAARAGRAATAGYYGADYSPGGRRSGTRRDSRFAGLHRWPFPGAPHRRVVQVGDAGEVEIGLLRHRGTVGSGREQAGLAEHRHGNVPRNTATRPDGTAWLVITTDSKQTPSLKVPITIVAS